MITALPKTLCVRAKLLQLCPTLCNCVDYSTPGYSVHRILQARIMEWDAMSSSRGSSRPRDQTHISCVYCMCLLHWQVDSLPLAPPDPAITLLDLNPRDENFCLHKNMYTIVHSSFIYNSQKLKTATMSFNRMIKQTLIYPYREILVCIKKE